TSTRARYSSVRKSSFIAPEALHSRLSSRHASFAASNRDICRISRSSQSDALQIERCKRVNFALMASSELDEQVSACWTALQEKNPLVMCVTNRVTPQRVADVLLAAGASPAMVDNPTEIPQFGEISSAIYVNTGLHESQAQALLALQDMYSAPKQPQAILVLDPVGYGASAYRNGLIDTFVKVAAPAAIKGNAAEIAGLAGVEAVGGKGVDAGDAKSVEMVGPAVALAKRCGCVVTVTGEVDVITDGTSVALARGSDPMMTKVTGTGCSLGALVAATMSAWPHDPFVAALTGHAVFKAAGGAAVAVSRGPGALQGALCDELYTLSNSPADLMPLLQIEQLDLEAPPSWIL
ncbi:hypothetical protein CYMTET_16172, partial [Cymbomonas tetramitiformis]